MNRQRDSKALARWPALLSLGIVLCVTVLVTAVASARTAAVPQNTGAPTISGSAGEGNTLTANNGTWSNGPTAFAYQWRRCDSGGSGCSDISGATKKTYTLASSDVDHTLRVVVTASNADGQSSATSGQTDVVSSKNAPVNTVKPAISGKQQVGEELSATAGTWTGGATSFSYQWQRCSPSGATGCVDVAGATGNTYGVRSADANNTLRVVVTAKNSTGSTTAASDTTGVIQAAGGTVTVTTTTTAKAAPRRAPTLSFLSLRRVGIRAYARFNVCDRTGRSVSVIERDVKRGVLSYTRRFTVHPAPCATYSRNWTPAPRFRHGKLTVTLRAVNRLGLSSRTVSRSIFAPAI
jgi:hypothetical protein